MIDILVRVTVLLVLVALTAHLLRRRSAALRHLVWSLAIVGLVALPVLTTLLPFRLRVLPAAAPRLADSLVGDSASVLASLTSETQSSSHVEDVGTEARHPADAGSAAAPGDVEATEDASAVVRGRLDVSTALVGMWIAGVLALLLRFVVGLVIVSRIARRARPVTDEGWHTMADRAAQALGVESPVDLRFSDQTALPFACGLLNPVIVLPSSAEGWSRDRREAVLMHEFAHISRGDLAMNTLSHLTRALYWPHPLAWLATHKLRVEGERASDDAVLRAGTVPSDYAEHLLSIVKTVSGMRAVPAVALAMARKSEFEGRLLAILEPGIPRSRLTRWRLAAMAFAFVTVVMPLAAMSPAAPVPRVLTAIPSGEPSAAPLQTPSPSPSPSPTPERPAPPAIQSTGAIGALIETLGDANAQVRLAAAKSLGQLGDPRAIAALAKALREDSDARVREAAAYALGEIDDTRAVAPLLDALKNEKVGSVREKIVRALGEIDDASAVQGIVAVLKDPTVTVRRAAVHALGELEDPSAVPALIGMVKDEDAEVRQYAAHAIGDLKGASTATAIDALAPLVRDPNADVRQQAVSSLGNLEDPRALASLVAALKDADPDVRSQAAEAIDNIDDLKQAPPALIEALSDPNREVRKQAAESLGSIGDAAAVPALKRLTADNDAEVRRSAAEALSEIGGPEAIQVLMGLLKDQDPEIRRIAAEALGSKRH